MSSRPIFALFWRISTEKSLSSIGWAGIYVADAWAIAGKPATGLCQGFAKRSSLCFAPGRYALF
jgi:hypothetical protein